MSENEKLVERLRKINVNYDLSPGIHATIKEAAAALTAAEARIKMLSEALEPFAAKTGRGGPQALASGEIEFAISVKLGDLRRARQALTGASNDG